MKKLTPASPTESYEPVLFRDVRPPRLAEYFLCLFLQRDARESISGDLLEEYRDAILPALGPARARIWYLKQVLSLGWHMIQCSTIAGISNVKLGCGLGVIFSIVIGLTNVVLPSMKINLPDAAFVNVAGWIGVFSVFGTAGFTAFRRRRSFRASLKAGGILAFASFTIAMLTFIVIDNLYLDLVSRQPEKIWLFQHSGYHSMRAYINHAHARALVFVLPLLTIVGSLAGVLGGVIGRVGNALR